MPWQAVQLSGATLAHDESVASGSLAGTVVSRSDGRGVSDARLSFSGWGGLHSIAADDSGRFRFEAPRPGPYELSLAEAEGYLPFAPEWGHSPISFWAREGERVDGVTIFLTPRINYNGRVVSPEGKPVEGAKVVLVGATDPGSGLNTPADTWISNASGEFTFNAQDGVILEARHPEFSPGRARVDFSVQVGKRLTIQMNPRGEARWGTTWLAGTVVDQTKKPVLDALVVAQFEADNPAAQRNRLAPIGRAISDEQGHFRIDGLDVGSYALVATAKGHGPGKMRGAKPPDENVILTLTQPGSIEGVVLSASKEPVASFTVFVSERVGALQRATVAVESQFDANGHYEVAGLTPGSYLVGVVAFGYAASEDKEVEVSTTTHGPARADFVLDAGGTVFGTVVSADHATAIRGAKVSVEATLRPEAAPVSSTLTDEQGRFALGGLGKEPFSLLVAASGHHGRIVSGVQVGADGKAGPLRVELTPTKDGEEPRIELAGIGAVLAAKEDRMIIGTVVAGGGAAEAGLQPGDAIVAVEGKPVAQLGFQGAIEAIRGPEGSTVRLSVVKANGDLIEVAVRRKQIRA